MKNIARRYLGDARIIQIIDEIGMNNTNLEENETTAVDIGNFFKNLWKNEYIDASDSEELLDYLSNTIYESHLPAGIPNDIEVSHKYGREVGVVNDAGIVFTKNPYIVVILSKDVMLAEADELFPELSRLIYEKIE